MTAGFAYHSLESAIRILAELGYRSAALTLDLHHLNPLDDDWPRRTHALKQVLKECNMRCTVETGARFLLDPRNKHQPTLLSADPADVGRRIEFLCRAIDVAADLEADCVSLWSGVREPEMSDADAFDRLRAGLTDVLAHAERHDIPVGFEPEPGMFIERMHQFRRLYDAIDHPLFGLTLDVGHVHCLRDGDLLTHLNDWRQVLLNVHLEDMRVGEHEHLMFGEGTLNFTELLACLKEIAYRGPVHVELSRHSHDAPAVAARAHKFLSALWPE